MCWRVEGGKCWENKDQTEDTDPLASGLARLKSVEERPFGAAVLRHIGIWVLPHPPHAHADNSILGVRSRKAALRGICA